ncbi:glutathione S-transferase [Roseovarius sp. SCSIO 43702]|uniref:glutathione S-transferase n=1 Tax=Roseovarius sp. SCSIO 43702 TaxID=2823043 RepID=UPI001C73B6BB|nr:glutathione S-transferase [Roseovarius sp. SCSIO 43702]QYX57635.1 glutathione S-transferase [Roseovarius sp. SCSIO 43702]
MTYDLFIGDRTFSSWSLRGWLMLAAFDIPHRVHMVGLYSGTMARDLAPLAPARLVPVLRDAEGVVIYDTLAMGETLAERHHDAGLWPGDPAARALARSIVAEMHSGFTALRSACPMQLAHAWEGFTPSAAVRADLDRIEALWSLARTRHGSDGPWLFGRYSLADAFYAPVAARIAGYGLPVGETARAYVAATLAQPLFRQWRAMGLLQRYDPMPYAQDLPPAPWPGPAPRPARAVDGTGAENTACPYSGRPVTHVLETDGRRFGFCNATCRDKTVIDPDAWPDFVALRDAG